MHQHGNNFLAHERLAIMDPASGDQPLFNEDKTIIVTVNGEIYNYQELRQHILEKCPNKKFATNSDCEVGTTMRLLTLLDLGVMHIGVGRGSGVGGAAGAHWYSSRYHGGWRVPCVHVRAARGCARNAQPLWN